MRIRKIAAALAILCITACGLGSIVSASAPATGTKPETNQEFEKQETSQDETVICSGQEYKDYLPIGSVVLLKKSTAKVMIIGYLQAMAGDADGSQGDKVYDYCGCLFPSGYEDGDHVYLFDHDQIDVIYDIGYINSESAEIIELVHDYIDGAKAS